jgi:2'-5' RNA ligase
VRLFIAVNVPPQVRREAWEAASALRQRRYPVKWVAPESLHVTVKFLGEVDDERAEQVVEALERAAAGAKPFPLLISGFGAFPSLRHPRVVWVGCDAAPPLELLQHRVECEMAEIGFPLEGRPFHPHITLGRARRDARKPDFAGFGVEVERLDYAVEITVESVDLMASTLTPSGAKYAVRHAVPLSG